MKLFKVVSLLSIIVALSGCLFLFGYDDDDISFYTVDEVSSLEYMTSFLGDAYISLNSNEDCRVIIDDYTMYTYFDGEYFIAMYPYEDGYVGIDSEVDRNYCADFNMYSAFIMEEDYTTGYSRVGNTNIYTKELDNTIIELLLNDDGYVVGIKVYTMDDDILITEIRNINDVEIVIPEHIVYTKFEFIFSHYPDLVYTLNENIFTTSSNGWMANINFSISNKITFTNSIDIYTYNFYDELFTLNDTEQYTLEEFLELNETFDEEFFNIVIDIYNKEINIEDYFDIPDSNPQGAFPGED